jgi:hypothetical protein
VGCPVSFFIYGSHPPRRGIGMDIIMVLAVMEQRKVI